MKKRVAPKVFIPKRHGIYSYLFISLNILLFVN